jgi:MFS family permease
MTPFSMFLALQPRLQEAWTLSNTASGWISSAYFTGYMLALPVLGGLTDRVDARGVWLGACALAGVGSVGFALLAEGIWTAVLLQLVTGAGLAGTYMPGLKVITDRLAELPRPRHVAFYTTSFTVGSSLSFWIIGHLESAVSWRAAVAWSSTGPLAGCLLVWLVLRRVPVSRHARVAPRVHVKAVLRSADSMRYVVGYAAHVWELFALRAWVVPFLVFCQGWRGTDSPVAVATLAALVSLVGVPSSLAGAELTSRAPRRQIIISVMLASILISLLVVPAAFVSWWLLILAVCGYNALISADSAALTSGIVAVAPAASRGTAMAIYSTLGFAAASAGTFAVGVALDLLGGQSILSWTVAFAIMSLPNLIGAVAIRRVTL